MYLLGKCNRRVVKFTEDGGIILKGNYATIIKNGAITNIEEDDLKKGDRVLVQAGDLVPADLKLIESKNLEVDEFELTGELLPIIKTLNEEDETILFSGSRITRGTATGIAVAVGDQTEHGGILQQKWEKDRPHEFKFFKKKYLLLVAVLLPALAMNLVEFNNSVAVTGFYLLLAVGFIFLQNNDLFMHFLILNEIKKCEELNIQIRDENIFEILNTIDIVCFDKTGILTTRQMDVKSVYFADKVINVGNAAMEAETPYLIKIACALCNDVLFFEKIRQADSRDKALISFAQKNGINIHDILLKTKRIYDLPFDSENRYMANGFQFDDGKTYYFAKGDPEVILKMCDSYLAENSAQGKIDSNFRLFIISKIDEINRNGNTVIALAYSNEIKEGAPNDLTFLCLVQLENPLQHGASQIVGKLTDMGIRSIMLTGDQGETAGRISEKCGITESPNVFLTGKMIERMALAEVARQAEYCSVFAKLLPSHKGVIIRTLQQRGHQLVMIGDGPNDGIALKVADAGISFVENSSPIARRLSKILINNLDDLIILFESGSRIKARNKLIKIFRVVILIAILAGLYSWILLFKV